MKPVLVIGAGGHAKVLVASLRRLGRAPIGCLAAAGPQIDGLPILGGDEMLDEYDPAAIELAMGIGSLGPGSRRRALFQELKQRGFRFATIVDPHAVLAEDCRLGEGAQIMAGAVVQPGCRIGANVVVNTRAAIDHDCRLDDHVHVAPGATLSGGVHLGEDCHVGTGAVVIEGRVVGAGALVAAGAVVVDDVPPGARMMGVPARQRSGA